MKQKCEKTKHDLDQLMEYQSKQEILKKEFVQKEMEVLQKKFDHALENNFEIIRCQNIRMYDLIAQTDILKKENNELKQRKWYTCNECDFETDNRDTIINSAFENQNDCENESQSESEEDERPSYQCDLCAYNSGCRDNVALHYREIHEIPMNWKEDEARLNKYPFICELEMSVNMLLAEMPLLTLL